MARQLVRIAWRVLKGALYVALAGVVLFFALTRTQVGRNGLRVQIEQQFNQRFQGTLRIGALQGNLAQALFARDVQLYDAQGRLVAEVDSVAAHPRWADLFRQRLSVGQLTLFRPSLHLLREADGSWNLAEALRPARQDTTGTSPWSFASDVRLVDGSITTRHQGPLPDPVAQERVFNYAHATLRDVQAAAHIEWQADTRVIDVEQLSGTLANPSFALRRLKGQFVLNDGALAVNHLVLETGRSQLRLSGSADRLALARSPQSTLSLDLKASHVNFDEWRHLFPALPLADTADVQAQLRGPLADLAVEHLSMERGQTQLRGTGTLQDLPDSLRFALNFEDNTATARDLAAVVPSVDWSDARSLGRVRGSLTTRGVLHPGAPTRLQVHSQLDVRTGAGGLSGTVALERHADRPLRYQANLQTDRLNLGRLLRHPQVTGTLNGRFTLRGQSLTPANAQTNVELHLADSRLGAVPLDSLDLTLEADSGRVRGTAQLNQDAGALRARLRADLAAIAPTYAVTLTGWQADIGQLLNIDSLSTRLNGRLAVRGTGRRWRTAHGRATLTLDSSAVRYGSTRRAVPPHRTTVTLAQRNARQPRLHVGGDMVEASLAGDVALRPLLALGRLWGTALRSAVAQEINKPYPRPGQQTAPHEAADMTSSEQNAKRRQLREATAARLQAAGYARPLRVQGAAHLKRPDLLTALLPALPSLPDSLAAQFDLTAGADTLHLDGHAKADSVRWKRTYLRAPSLDFTVASPLSTSLVSSLEVDLTLSGETARIGSQQLRAPRLTIRHAQRTSRLQLTSGPPEAPGPVHLAATLALLDDRNRLTLTDVHLAAGNDYVWTQAGPDRIDLYADAVLPTLTLENSTSSGSAVQRLSLGGILSDAPQDTLFLQADNLALRELSQLAALKHPVGGRLSGRLSFTGATRRPELTGRLDVRTLSFDDRILGHLAVDSRYTPHTPGVALRAALRPPQTADTTYLAGTQIPARVEPSRLQMNGTFRLPHRALGHRDDGALNLQLDVDRADAFFLEYLLKDNVTNVGGGLQGTGRLTGDFRAPILQADLQLAHGRLNVPKFNLPLAAEGPVHVSKKGIQFTDFNLHDPTGGSATVNGHLLFNGYRYFSFDLAASLDELRVMNQEEARDLPFYGEIWGSGDLTLTGPISDATLRSTNAELASKSEVYIPFKQDEASSDAGFIVFADSTGQLPDLDQLTRRKNILSDRPPGERRFAEGLDLDLNLLANEGTTVRLVIDPLLGDEINAVGSGRIQLQRTEGSLYTYGSLNVSGGDYLFTAGELFSRRFRLNEGGTISWDGAPTNPTLDLTAAYRTRASSAGLRDLVANLPSFLPVVVQVHVTRRVASPQVNLDLIVDRGDRNLIGNYEGLETYLNQSDRAAEYATSVLLTNSFLLTTSLTDQSAQRRGSLEQTRNQLAFSSVSQLVASQLNRYLSAVIPNFDMTFGLAGQSAQDLGVTYGVALHLLDERLVIRGEGAYQNESTRQRAEGLAGEFVVEVRLTPNVSAEAFYRRESDLLNTDLTNTTGAGLSYETQFTTWRRLVHRLFGWLLPDDEDEAETPDAPPPDGPVAATHEDE